MNTVRKLRKYWEDHRLAIVSKRVVDEVAAFERAHDVVLPLEFKNYLTVAGGAERGELVPDERGFNFWPLSKVCLVESLSEVAVRPTAHHGKLLAFCDYLDWCWGYAISPKNGAIFKIGTADGVPAEVASTFAEFIDFYMADNEKLYG